MTEAQIISYMGLDAWNLLVQSADCVGRAKQWVEQMSEIEQIILNQEMSIQRTADGRNKLMQCCSEVAQLANEAIMFVHQAKSEIEKCR